MGKNTFDLIVIGAGPGGYVAAIRAAQLGMHVCCIDKGPLGGTCLVVGCIPSKALLDSSELYYQAKTSFERHGIHIGSIDLNLPAMMQRKDKIVQGRSNGVKSLFTKNKIEHVVGTARIKNPSSVEIHNGKETSVLSAKRILIATGSAPIALPGLPFDGTHIISSTEALALPKAPEKLIIIGAGAIGLELGSVWSRLGSKITVVEILDHIVPGMDREMTAQLQRLLEKQGFTFKLKTSAAGAEIKNGKVQVTLSSGSEQQVEECDRVLVAVGRRAYTEGLGLEELKIKQDEKRRIVVNKRYETSVSGIYAIGDVIPGPMLAHKAEEEGIAAVELMAGKAGHVNYTTIPAVVYTFPELASVGITEEQVREKGLKVRIGKFPFRANGRAHCLDAVDGLVKIISDENTNRILGMHILSARASDIIAEGVIAMEFAGSAEDLARSVHAHPTLPEAIKEAALAVDGRAIHS